jgi:hypothetical protein
MFISILAGFGSQFVPRLIKKSKYKSFKSYGSFTLEKFTPFLPKKCHRQMYKPWFLGH